MRLTTLGALELQVGRKTVADLPARPSRAAILVYLACEGVTTRDKVVGVFWPERPPERGRGALSQTLHVLRREFGAEWLDAQGDQLRVTDSLQVDAEAFEELAREGRWEEALRLYGGRFLDGFYLVDTNEFERWVSLRLRRLEEFHYEAHRRLVAERREKHPAGAVEAARAWVRAYPHMEEAQLTCVRLLAAAGRRSEALRQWEHFQRRLGEDDLPEPSEAWRQLGERLRRSNPAELAELAEVADDDGRGGTAPWHGTPVRGPRLVRMVNGKEAESYRLRTSETALGRDEGHLTFPEDRLMSSRHAVFSVEERRPTTEGDTTGAHYVTYRCTVRDCGSRNGIYLRIQDDWPLESRDMFAVGQQLFRFETGTEASP